MRDIDILFLRAEQEWSKRYTAATQTETEQMQIFGIEVTKPQVYAMAIWAGLCLAAATGGVLV